MEELLNSLYGNTSVPFWSALLLGLMTAISPCPLATNITAIGFISKDIENRKRVFLNGIYYTLGRAISYTTIGLLFYFGASQFELSGFFQQWGEKFIGPLLVVIGLFMLGVIKLNIPGLSSLSQRMEKKNSWGFWSSLLLGMLFALAFCPYSGVLYFGMLIPMTISSASGLYLPVVFAFATGLPVLLFAWFIAFSFSKLGGFYSKVKVFEKWFRKFVALLFIGVGLYYIILLIF
ncbi:MAG: aromatic aminobenezylarsenical efflux permease ArsG family transporter [Prolixibacteraceae bacterium]|nr:aromatic aminobenezylarsenical efflux permease ArsG family transporter [Prolixibacteraceae bacterium]